MPDVKQGIFFPALEPYRGARTPRGFVFQDNFRLFCGREFLIPVKSIGVILRATIQAREFEQNGANPMRFPDTGTE